MKTFGPSFLPFVWINLWKKISNLRKLYGLNPDPRLHSQIVKKNYDTWLGGLLLDNWIVIGKKQDSSL
jgi:hypothetical protein